MAELTPDITEEVVEACRGGVGETADALHRALGTEVALKVGQPGSFQSNALTEDLAGPGLVLVLRVGDAGALVTVPESTGLVPSWCAAPDPTGKSKLATLAQEFGMLVLPGSLMPDASNAGRVDNLAGALARGGVGDGAAMVPLEVSLCGQQRGAISVIWPVPRPQKVLETPAAKPAPSVGGGHGAAPVARPGPIAPNTTGRLPAYSRSLLRIKVPVAVKLASKRQPLGRVVEMSPGAIIQFDKSCEEMLELMVGDLQVALGEAVKVGDKFALRVTSMVMPEERFQPVRPCGGSVVRR
jgi:flagellar motor switch/type III secretory pathway protein FliN